MTQAPKIIAQGLVTTSPPKPHAFVNTEFKSSMSYGVLTLGIVSIVTTYLASGFQSSTILDMLYQTSGLSVTVLINHIEPIIRGMIAISIRLSADLNGTGLSYLTLDQVHTYLTSHILTCQNIAYLLSHYIGNLGASADLDIIQSLFTRFTDALSVLLSQYRLLENTLGIPLADSPIPA